MINPYLTLLCICCLAIPHATIQAQTRFLTLAESYTLAIENYPMAKQRNLIARSAVYSIEQANTGYLPQININGQATYQSAVTQIPIQVPGIDMPSLSKDQYKLYGEMNQSLYDAGVTKLQKQATVANASVEEQALEVELHGIKERINQLFFGVLLLDAQLEQNSLLEKDIRAGLEKTNTAIANGTALKSSGSLLEAELLKARQRTVELQTTRKAYVQMLGLFINRQLDENTVFERPESLLVSQEINRPELGLYTAQQNNIDVENKMLTAKNLPKLGFFLQGGFGRPALNMLSNAFEAYYYGGIRLSIPLSGFYTLKKERALLGIRQEAIAVQEETFLFNTDLSLKQQNTELTKYETLLETDNEIIALRTSVKDAALAQLENGVINTADYVREVHAEDNAKLTKILHEIQLLMIQYDIQQTTGN
ncbi:TolC family protein [Parapedobacter tibetensis]|uniref:TolC family protein n=1 Tax=Parapedobacter tibetensis TaxID=2972951 RepID=UPI00214D682A|nr:TolC family protein [Parapedobacter tibetensis]